MPKPSPTSYPVYFQRYVDQVPEQDLAIAFSNQAAVINSFLSSISEERSMHAYAEGKWTIKELMNAAQNFSKKTKSRVTFEYIVLDGINDSEQDAKRGTTASLAKWSHRLGDRATQSDR